MRRICVNSKNSRTDVPVTGKGLGEVWLFFEVWCSLEERPQFLFDLAPDISDCLLEETYRLRGIVV